MIFAPNHRWFRFSLRTLFVALTLACLWLGWNVNKVRNRKHLIKWADNHGVEFREFSRWRTFSPQLREHQAVRLPQTTGIGWFRKTFLEDQPAESIWIPEVWRNEVEVAQIKEAFPEAEIFIGGDL